MFAIKIRQQKYRSSKLFYGCRLMSQNGDRKRHISHNIVFHTRTATFNTSFGCCNISHIFIQQSGFDTYFFTGVQQMCNWSLNPATLYSPQHKHWPTGPAHFSDRRASTLYLSLALQDHRVKCRASRLKITVARSMTNFATFSCILFLKFRYVCIELDFCRYIFT